MATYKFPQFNVEIVPGIRFTGKSKSQEVPPIFSTKRALPTEVGVPDTV